MEGPLLADIQQKTFEGNRGGRPMDLIARTATQGLYLRRHSKIRRTDARSWQDGGLQRSRPRLVHLPNLWPVKLWAWPKGL